MARSSLKTAVFLAILVLSAPAVAGAAAGRTAVLVDLTVDEPIAGDAVVFGGDLTLRQGARVSGDALAVGGSVLVEPGAVVEGHVVTVFGRVSADSDAEIGGRTLSLASVATLSRSTTGPSSNLRVDTGLRLLASGGWLLVTTGLAFLFPVRMRWGAWTLPALGFRVPALGLLVALTLVTLLIAVLGLGAALGTPLGAALMVTFFAAKCAGLTVVGCVVGNAVLRRWLHHPLPISLEVFVGVLVLLALRFVPVAGETLWTVIALLSLGASVVLLGVIPRPPKVHAS